jgi:hypothetical protein
MARRRPDKSYPNSVPDAILAALQCVDQLLFQVE